MTYRLPLSTLLAALLLAGAGSSPAWAAKNTSPPLVTLDEPGNFTATDGQFNTGIRLHWNDSMDASYYDLYRNTTPDFTTAKLRAHVRILAFNDRQTLSGINYYYWIYARAINRTSDPEGPEIGIRGLAPRFVIEPPRHLIVTVGGTLTITATANGYPAITYQWYKGSTELTDGGSVSGSQTNTLVITPLQTTDANNRYFLRIKNTTGATNSLFTRVEVVRP